MRVSIEKAMFLMSKTNLTKCIILFVTFIFLCRHCTTTIVSQHMQMCFRSSPLSKYACVRRLRLVDFNCRLRHEFACPYVSTKALTCMGWEIGRKGCTCIYALNSVKIKFYNLSTLIVDYDMNLPARTLAQRR